MEIKKWFSAIELAGLPGMPGAKINVLKKAQRENWPRRKRQGKGGGWEYPLTCLPSETQTAIAAQQAEEIQEAADQDPQIQSSVAPSLAAEQEKHRQRLLAHEKSLAEFRLQEDWQQRKAQAKWEVIQACKKFVHEEKFELVKGQQVFCTEYSRGRISLEGWVFDQIPEVSWSTLRKWIQAEFDAGMLGLVDQYGVRRGTGQIETDPELRKIILGHLGKSPHARASAILEAIRAQHPQYKELNLRTLQRFVRSWKDENAQVYTFITNPDAWRSKYQVAIGDADEEILRLNQLWEMDSTPADVMLVDGRHHVLGVIDVWSRRMRLLVSKTSKAAMVATLLRRAILTWGVPEAVKTDNGKEYVSNHFQRVLEDLRIRQALCQPFSPEQKPFIERGLKTFLHGLLELKPTFIGHNVAERKAIQARESFAQRMMQSGAEVEIGMTAGDLQAFCDDWCESVYGRNAHRGLDGQSPFERACSWTGEVRTIANERALDMLLAEAPLGGSRTITATGIHVDGANYVHDEMGAHIGKRVLVLRDPDDLGTVYLYDVSGAEKEYLFAAVCPERAGISRAEAAAVVKAKQKEYLKAADDEIKAGMAEIRKTDVADLVLEHRKEEAAQVTAFPRPTTAHETPALDAAERAAESRRWMEEFETKYGAGPQSNRQDAASTPSALDHHPIFREETKMEEPDERYERLIAQGEISDEDVAWMRRFEKTPEGRAIKKFLEYKEEVMSDSVSRRQQAAAG